MNQSPVNRRLFLRRIVQIMGGVLCVRPSTLAILNDVFPELPLNASAPSLTPRVTAAAPLIYVPKIKKLSIYNIHTGEWLKNCDIRSDAPSIPFAQDLNDEIKRIFKDHRTEQTHAIDENLIRLMHRILKQLDGNYPIHLVSGYRSKASNQLLLNTETGVSKNSHHTRGKAADIYVEGVSNQRIQKIALGEKIGGVGRYPHFVHIDTGRVRRWGLIPETL